jgi:VCBS repeat protein
VLYGKKDGFKPARTYSSDITQTWITVGDVNRDGRPDVVFSTDEDAPNVMLALKGGGFRDAQSIPGGHAASFVVLADFNRDHKLDVVASNESSDDLSYYAGNGDGTFDTPSTINLPAGGTPYTLVAADLNHDGKKDLAVLAQDTGSGSVISPLYGNGHGSFSPGTSTIAAGGHLYGMVAGHFDSDKRLDFAAAACGAVYVVHGTKHGFSGSKEFANDDHSCPLEPAAVDLNGDGRTDLVSTEDTGPAPGKVAVMLGKPKGKLGAPHSYQAIKGGTIFRYVVSADFNKDGRPDLATPAGGAAANQGVGVLYGKRK